MFILASSSPRRIKLLNKAGFYPDLVLHPDIDELSIKHDNPSILATELASKKAASVYAGLGHDKAIDSVVLGADTVVYCRRKVLGKPQNKDEAKKFISMLSGRRHRVYTGVSIVCASKIVAKHEMTTVKFKRLHHTEIDYYVDSIEWEGKSGGYAIQGLASIFIEWISGTESNVMGLPISTTYKMLLNFGIRPRTMP